jgi:cell division septum initiation protein DivIVA
MADGQHAEELAAKAAEAVRRVVAAAETRAAEIVREAEADADRIREAAEAKATEIREQAEADARERIETASKALEELRGKLSGAGDARPPPAVSPEPVAEPEPVRAVPEVPAAPQGEAGASAAAGNGDDAAARLVAMKLAVDGKGRDEIEAELTQRFGPGDRSRLLDDVLARAGG